MNNSFLRSWGITISLMVVAMIPTILLFAAFTLHSHYSNAEEIEHEVNERGRLIATTLAEHSSYGVISGNIGYIDTTIETLLANDRSIVSVLLLNSKGEVITSHKKDVINRSGEHTFEAPITAAAIPMDPFGVDGDIHFSGATSPDTRKVKGEPIKQGIVRLVMSEQSVIELHRERTVVRAVFTSIALVISVAIGLFLISRITKPLESAVQAVRQIRAGDYAVALPVSNSGAIGDLQSSVNEMACSLNRYRNDMERQVALRTTELEAARDAAVTAAAEKRKLIQLVNTAVEEERKAIAVDIHDHLNASLIVIRLEAQRILSTTAKMEASPSVQKIQETATSVVAKINDLYKMARDIVKRLRPEVIDTLGLRDAVDEMVRSYDSIHPTCRFSFASDGDFSNIDNETAITAYRLAQEALSNVHKHAAATECTVAMCSRSKDTSLLHIVITDNGKGFDQGAVVPGVGLLGMRERVFGIGGSMELTSSRDSGTAIHFTLPLSPTSKRGGAA